MVPRTLLSLLSAALVASTLSALPAQAGPPAPPAAAVVKEPSVPGRGAPAVAHTPDPDKTAAASTTTNWPQPADVTVSVPDGHPVQLGDLPVTIAGAGAASAVSKALPAQVRARSLGHDPASHFGTGTAMALELRRTDGQSAADAVKLTVNYSRFADAYGGSYADRLRVVKLPGTCADHPENAACAGGTPVVTSNNATTQTLTATVAASSVPVVYAVTPMASGQSGDYRATDLSDSAKWMAGEAGGAFTYSYPLELPAPPYGKAPDLSLNYNSGSVDGRSSKSNNQASWVGQGWDLSEPYIQRVYKSCSEDGHVGWGDLCWSSPYSGDPAAAEYIINFGGHTTELIKAADGSYRMRDDESYKIEHVTGGPNDDNDGEYWIISTLDGSRYYFGYGEDKQRTTHAKTNSNWIVPVVSDDSGEPCHQSDLASCKQTYRWNLDHIHDPNENWTVLYYATETNTYRRTSSGNDLSYIRGGYLSKIEYGKTETPDAEPPAYVSFTHYNRCKQRTTVDEPDLNPPADCPTIASSPSSYPDVPTDQICSSGCSKHSPTFFVTDWLDSVSTFVRNAAGTGYDPVTKYQFKYAFPATDDGTQPALWLDYVRRIGLQGGTIREPVTNFDGHNLNNRVDWNASLGVKPLSMRRVTNIHNEFGGETKVTYDHATGHGCFVGGSGATGWDAWYKTKDGHWDTNDDECYPQLFKPDGAAAGFGIFHKYSAVEVRDIDHVGGQPDQVTSYAYLGNAAWAHDEDMITPSEQKTWGDWRGYQQVRVTKGEGLKAERTVKTTTYYRGLNEDIKADGSARGTTLTDYDNNVFYDYQRRAGQRLQTQDYRLGDDDKYTELSSERWIYTDTGITANGPGLHNAYQVREQKHYTRDRRDDGTWQATDIEHTYDAYGLEATESDLGDTAIATDDTCTTTSYARNTDDWRWMIDYPETAETHQGTCTGPVIARKVTLYDGAASTDDAVNKPFDGNATEVRSYTDANTASTVKHTYDDQGRVKTETDPLGKVSTSAYAPATGYPTDGVTVTNPLNQSTVTVLSPAFGQAVKVKDLNGKVTESDYDALGRLVAVWRPTEPRSGGTASSTFSYVTPATGITAPTGPTLVTSRQLQSGTGTSAVWLSSYEYDDGFGSAVESQTPAPQGGRAVTVTRNDSRGLSTLESQPFYNSADAGSGLLNPAENAIPQYSTTSYDAQEQPIADVTKAAGAELWRTTTSYHGDHTVEVSPTGGQTVTWTDVHDKNTLVQNYLDSTRHQDTEYTYTPTHELATVTDPNGNVSTYSYDWLGHRLTADDPDSGKSTTAYDLAGKVASVTDAKAQKVSIGYDDLGRKTSSWLGDVDTGEKLAAWTYDNTLMDDGVTRALGQVSSSTSYAADGKGYTATVNGYDSRYRVTARSVTIPAPSSLAGAYNFAYQYDAADHQASITYPEAGGLPKETVTQAYTSLGLPSTLAGAATYVTGTGYSDSLKLASRNYGSSVQRQYSYETTTNRLSGIKTVVSGNTVQDDGYTYDQIGNVKTIADRVANQSQCFGYDGRDRLTTAYTTTTSCPNAADTGGPDPYDLAYTYDGSGNIASASSNGATTTYTYPAQGAGSVRPHAVSAVGTNTYTYDADGNLQTRKIDGTASTLTWDAQNQLTALTTSTGTTNFVYSADGDRLLRSESGSTTLFLDGTELVAGAGGVTATRYYNSGGAVVAQRTPAGLTWLTADQQGSAQLAINAAGAVSRQRYLPNGAPRGAGNQLPTDRGFLGKVQDKATGLDLLGARYYDPTIAKFVSPDPLDNNAEPDTANPYSYAADNPITYSDPTGLKPADCWGSCMKNWEKSQAKRARHYHAPRGSSHHSTSHRSAGPAKRHYPGCYIDSSHNYCGADGNASYEIWHPGCHVDTAHDYCGSHYSIAPKKPGLAKRLKGLINNPWWKAGEAALGVCSFFSKYCAGAGAVVSSFDAGVYIANHEWKNSIDSGFQAAAFLGAAGSGKALDSAQELVGIAKADRAVLRATGEPATDAFVIDALKLQSRAWGIHVAFSASDLAAGIGSTTGTIGSLIQRAW
ncbi:RHS repeat-associated core domain-containing protein [Kribbella sp. NPDC049227]|uniref:RHS repeat-associated core domain-containing protein n=1 Tax=Kribbella sp. NPDC049227 TaxID=3364113 RepID=UPI003716CCFD